MRRIVSVWLPNFATDRLQRLRQSPTSAPPSEASSETASAPLATATCGRGGIRIVAVNGAARAAGIRPGTSLADARSLLPTITVQPTDPLADHRALAMLADWCGRYTPWATVDNDSYAGGFGGGAGLFLDVSGCAHLFGGEDTLLRDLLARLDRLGYTATAAIAGTAGAAWAVARFGGEKIVVLLPEGALTTVLARLPVRSLRLPPETAILLQRIGLRRIGDLLALPRAPLAARFGEVLLRRLDQALGHLDEPLSPRRPPPAFLARLAFAEPLSRVGDLALALHCLLVDLCARLDAAHKGARRLELAAFRTDATAVRIAVGTSRATRTPRHLQRLFREKLDGLDPSFGIEVMTLGALVVDPLAPSQPSLGIRNDPHHRAESLAQLIDRLGNRLGGNAVVRLAPHTSHVPERACREAPAMAGLPATPSPARSRSHPLPSRERVSDAAAAAPPPLPSREREGPAQREGEGKASGKDIEDHRSRQVRPLHLLASAEPIEVIAPVPDGPPVLFRWRQTRYLIASAEGPERIGPEWWLLDGGHGAEELSRIRDYYRVEDNNGRRFWIYREGLYRPDRLPHWYLHGMFG
jgi:protein ImuB